MPRQGESCISFEMRICSLASGSKGNCLYIESGGIRLLVDVGLSLREITARLELSGIAVESIHGILVTHEHGDHVHEPLFRALLGRRGGAGTRR